VTDYAAHLLVESGQVSGNVFKGNDRDIERIADADMTACLVRSVDVKASCHKLRLVCDDTYRSSAYPCKTGNDIAGIHFLHFAEISVVNDFPDDVADIVAFVGICRDHLAECGIHA